MSLRVPADEEGDTMLLWILFCWLSLNLVAVLLCLSARAGDRRMQRSRVVAEGPARERRYAAAG
jgi:hypothetical protein